MNPMMQIHTTDKSIPACPQGGGKIKGPVPSSILTMVNMASNIVVLIRSYFIMTTPNRLNELKQELISLRVHRQHIKDVPEPQVVTVFRNQQQRNKRRKRIG